MWLLKSIIKTYNLIQEIAACLKGAAKTFHTEDNAPRRRIAQNARHPLAPGRGLAEELGGE